MFECECGYKRRLRCVKGCDCDVCFSPSKRILGPHCKITKLVDKAHAAGNRELRESFQLARIRADTLCVD